MPADVVVYTTTYCPYCTRAKTVLSRKGAAFKEVDVTEDEERRTWLTRTTGQKTVPQIFINEASIGGCDDLIALDRAGKLDVMLATPPASAR